MQVYDGEDIDEPRVGHKENAVRKTTEERSADVRTHHRKLLR